MAPQTYYLVSLPASISASGDASEALTTLRSAVSTDNGTTYPFNIPHFKIGTLDALVQQADELARLEGGCKGVVDKVGDSLRSLLEGDEDKIQEQKVVNDRECSSFLILLKDCTVCMLYSSKVSLTQQCPQDPSNPTSNPSNGTK